MKTVVAVGIAFLGMLLLVSCSATHEAFIGIVNQMVADGKITPEQGQAMIAAFLEWQRVAGGYEWWELILTGLGSALSAWLGINFFPGKRISNAAVKAIS